MWSLIRTEFARLRLRRAVLVLLAAMIVVPLVIFAGQAWDTRPVTDAEYAEAQAQYNESLEWAKEELPTCLADPANYGVDPELADDELARACEESVGGGGAVEDFLYRSPLEIGRTNEESGVAVLTVLALLAALIGTTFVGHDWASGSMSNQLLFENRRPRIWLAKAVAVVLGPVAVAAIAAALFWTGIWILTQTRDVDVSSALWQDVMWTQLRGLGLVACAALAAYALTMLFRSTVGSLGLMFGVTLFSSVLIAAVVGSDAERWMLPTNALAVVMDGLEYWVPTGECDEFGNCDDTRTLTAAHGATYLGVLLVLIVIPSILTFRRRDVP